MASKESKKVQTHDGTPMDDLKRRFQANPFLFIGTIVILLFTIIAFVLVPAMAPDYGSGAGKLGFGTYDGVPIDFVPGNYFAQQRDYYNEQIRSAGNDQNLQVAAYQVWRAAFESTVIRTAALREMKAAGYLVPPEVVDRRMAQLPAFQENGKFSAARYRAMGEADRLSLRSDLHDEVAANHYLEDLLGLRISSKETEFMKAMAGPERSFDVVALPLSSYPETEVASYVNANADLFRLVHLSRITISSSEADAKKVLQSVKDGTSSFEDAAKTHSKDEYADKGGDLGLKYAYELTTDIPDQAERGSVLNLAKGELSALVKVPAGFAFFRAEEAARASSSADKAVIAKARSYIISFERGRVEDWLITQAEAFAGLAAVSGFDAAAAERSLNKKSFGPVPLNYGDIELYRSLASFKIAELSGASSNENFWKTAFSTPVGTVSKPVVVGDNVLVLQPTLEQTAEASATGIIDYYYPYIAGQYAEATVRSFVLGSKKFEDRFIETFMQNFMPEIAN